MDNLFPLFNGGEGVALENGQNYVDSFLKDHLLFRGRDFTWQEIMRLDPELVELKVRAEVFGKEYVEGYTKNASGKILFKTPKKNYWLEIDQRYDVGFMESYIEMAKKKLTLKNNDGERQIKLIQLFKEGLKNHYTKGGHLAMGSDLLLKLYPLFIEMGDASRLLISKDCMATIHNRSKETYSRNEKEKDCSSQLEKWEKKGMLPKPLPVNRKAVTKRGGLLKLKKIYPNYREEEISAFIQPVKEGKNVLFVGDGWNDYYLRSLGVPIYTYPDGISMGLDMELLLWENEEELMELESKVLFLPQVDSEYRTFLYNV